MTVENMLDTPIEGALDISWKNSFDVPMTLDEELRGDPYAYVVWCHLARRAARKGISWPSTRTMSDDLGISRTRVIQAIKTLQTKNLLLIESRQRPNGSLSSNVYQCLPPGGGGTLNGPGVVHLAYQGGPPGVPPPKLLKEETLKRKNKKYPPNPPTGGNRGESNKGKGSLVTEQSGSKDSSMSKKPQNQGQQWIPQIQAGVEQSNGDRPPGMPALEVIKGETARFGLPDSDAEAIYDAWLTTGFKTARNIKIKDWRAAIRTWYRNGWFPSLRRTNKYQTRDREAEELVRIKRAKERQEQYDSQRARKTTR